MGSIRSFIPEDIPLVADLWQRVFHKSSQTASAELRAYFADIFFHNPWYDKTLPCLVYEERGEKLGGFLGVIPREMAFQGRPVRVAVATQLMVDPAFRDGFAAFELLKHFFSRSQDLSYSDGANEIAANIWRRVGGQVAMLYSMDWTRVLRPAEYFRQGRRRDLPSGVARLAYPACLLLDAAAARLPLNPFRPPRATAPEEEATPEAISACLDRLAGSQALMPSYSPETLRWVLDKAGEARGLGELLKVLVRDARGEAVGWYVYYLKPGGIGEVLQVAGRKGLLGQVLEHLFHHSWRRGAIGVRGQLNPIFAHQLWDLRCGLAYRGQSVLVQSNRQDLLCAIHRGDALLTRLDGEWWLRLGIDRALDW